MLAVRGMHHHLKGWKLVCSRRYYAKNEESIKHLSPEDNAAAKRAAAAKALAQTNNPAVLKAVESVIKGMQASIFGCELCVRVMHAVVCPQRTPSRVKSVKPCAPSHTLRAWLQNESGKQVCQLQSGVLFTKSMWHVGLGDMFGMSKKAAKPHAKGDSDK